MLIKILTVYWLFTGNQKVPCVKYSEDWKSPLNPKILENVPCSGRVSFNVTFGWFWIRSAFKSEQRDKTVLGSCLTWWHRPTFQLTWGRCSSSSRLVLDLIRYIGAFLTEFSCTKRNQQIDRQHPVTQSHTHWSLTSHLRHLADHIHL